MLSPWRSRSEKVSCGGRETRNSVDERAKQREKCVAVASACSQILPLDIFWCAQRHAGLYQDLLQVRYSLTERLQVFVSKHEPFSLHQTSLIADHGFLPKKWPFTGTHFDILSLDTKFSQVQFGFLHSIFVLCSMGWWSWRHRGLWDNPSRKWTRGGTHPGQVLTTSNGLCVGVTNTEKAKPCLRLFVQYCFHWDLHSTRCTRCKLLLLCHLLATGSKSFATITSGFSLNFHDVIFPWYIWTCCLAAFIYFLFPVYCSCGQSWQVKKTCDGKTHREEPILATKKAECFVCASSLIQPIFIIISIFISQ